VDPIKEKIIDIAEFIFNRHLTDLAGGNISVREGDKIYITPRYAGNNYHWKLSAEDIVSGPVLTEELKSHPAFSREGISHMTVYRAYPEVKAIIHAHPFHILPFCAANRSIPPVLRAVKKLGEIKQIADSPAYSQEQADLIVEGLKGKESLLKDVAAAVLLPYHGIFVAGKDLNTTLDILERIDTNAWCIIARKSI